MKEKIVSFLALFTSTGTLLCCALPAALAVLAGGAAIGAYVSVFPWIIPLSQHKDLIFVIAGVLLAINAVFTLRPQGKLACAVTGGKGCEVAGKFNRVMFWITVTVYSIGAFSTYALAPLMMWLNP